MFVNCFLEEEKKDLIADNDEWKTKIEELGLEGQKSLYEEGKSPIPFKLMDRGMVRIYEILLNRRDSVEKFDKEPIPLKILSLIALAKQENYFGKLEIWYSATDPDPIVVGERNGQQYILGQWSSEDLSPEQIRDRAIEKATTKLVSRKHKAIEEAKTLIERGIDLEQLKNDAKGYILGEESTGLSAWDFR